MQTEVVPRFLRTDKRVGLLWVQLHLACTMKPTWSRFCDCISDSKVQLTSKLKDFLVDLAKCCPPKDPNCLTHEQNCYVFRRSRCCPPMICLSEWRQAVGKCSHRDAKSWWWVQLASYLHPTFCNTLCKLLIFRFLTTQKGFVLNERCKCLLARVIGAP